CVYFYIINLNNISNQYTSGTGLWWKMRYVYILEAVGNLGLNILFGKFYGINGILWATIITIFCFNFLCQTDILFHNYFKGCSLFHFLKEQAYYGFITIVCITGTYWLCVYFFEQATLLSLLGRFAICALVPPIIFVSLVWPTKRFKQAQNFIQQIIHTYLKRKKQNA
ncbi:MAG: polysaccharide biosynthesis C-terminal domain-containing protein, partial [Elusimicrobiaceae bacterium]|nr:polysaccharide biosynthesis C-terminal domain-containing protein [Elusimicrobiaceae bacterium]